MGVIKKFNPETGEWEVYGSTEASDINLLDVGDNFSDKNVEGALREISDKVSESIAELTAQTSTLIEHRNTLLEHASAIEWLKENGGGGGGGTGGGAVAPTITSTFEDGTIVTKEQDVKIPIFFASPNLGEGTAYVLIDNVEVAIITGIQQGNNVIDIGKLTNLRNTVSIYVKDRTNMLSNQLTWTIIAGGIDLEVDFDATDYYITDKISMQFNVTSASTEPIIMHMTIDYDEFEVECNQGFNEYTYPELGVGIHSISFYLTSGPYQTSVQRYNIVIVSSNTLYVSSIFENNSEFVLGEPVAVQYRISKASTESFNVKLFLNDKLNKELSCTVGTYYWTLNDLDVGSYKVRIEVSGAYDTAQFLEYNFTVTPSDYIPLKVSESGLSYRLSAKSRTNQDVDRANPIDDSGNGVVTTLHNFNWFTNGWIDGELVCDSNAYVEIDLKPWEDNAIFGSTIEIQYTALDIGFTDSRILDYTDIETPFKGAYIDIEESTLRSLANTGQVTLDKDVETTVTFVIDRKEKFGKIFINGICSRAFSLSDSGSGVNATREDFTHSQKIYLNSRKGESNFGACKIKDFRVYNRVLTDDEIVSNYIAQISDLKEQERMYNFNFNNTTLPVIRMYGDMTNMTLETPVNMRIKYTSPNEDLYGQSFDLPYCPVNWQGTSSLQYVLKNFTARLRDENMAVYEYTPYVNGIKEDVYCFKADYMESTHSRNVGIAKFVNECLYDSKNPMQLQDANIRNSINGFPCIMYINDELQGVYNFNLDRYSTKSFGYTDEEKCLVYEVSANSDTTAGAFYKWTEATGKDKLSYYKSDFECVYPPTRAAGNDNMSELIRLIEWVNDSSDEDFKDNFERYFNKEYVLRYYLFVLVFGAVDSLGKNMKLASWDGLTWYPQVYDADTTIGLDNTGFLKFDMDIEMGDENVFNTTGSQLWKRIVLLFQEELKQQYSLMRQDRFTVDNIMKYLYGEQISQIPATYYNKDMQTKYLNYGSSYLYALHGNGENHIRKWIRERIMYVDTLLGYMTSSADYITLRSSKLGEVYLDIETYIPMYVSVKWRDEANNTGLQTKRVGRGETVRFTYNMPTATDQEILVYAGHYLKRLGNVSNLQPTSMLIANADRLTEIECHSSNLINTDLSECTYLQRIDLSDCTALGTGIGAQPILNIQKCKYLRYCNCSNTKLTSIYTMQSGGNLEEIYYPESTQVIQLSNQTYLRVAGIPFKDGVASQNLADVNISNCNNLQYIHYPYEEGDELNFNVFKYVQNLTLINSLGSLTTLRFNGFNKLANLELGAMANLETLGFDNMLTSSNTPTLSSVRLTDCPLVKKLTFNVTSNDYKIAFKQGTTIDLAGMHALETIESNASIKGLQTIILPLSTKEIVFTGEFGDGENDIINLWSSNVNHHSDGFKGIDFKDINLTLLDMKGLPKITNGANFHLVLTDTNPNMNVFRNKAQYPYFQPQGIIDLTDYTGDMTKLLKGLDLNKVRIIIGKRQSQQDLSYLLQGAIIPNPNTLNNILDRYPLSSVWDYVLNEATLQFPSDEIEIPTDRPLSLTGFFKESNADTDFIIPANITSAREMFMYCKNIEDYVMNWENDYYGEEFLATDCYFGTGGDLEFVSTDWGGYGFYDDVISVIYINVPESNYKVKLAAANNITSIGYVSWGDGELTKINGADEYNYEYKEPGIYKVRGHFTFGKNAYPHESISKLISKVEHLATSSKDLGNAFYNCTNITEITMNNLSPTSLKATFNGCSSLKKLTMNNIDTSFTTDMSNVFAYCSVLSDVPTHLFDTQRVKTMRMMFYECTSLTNLDLSNFNTLNTTSMAYMFYNCSNLLNLNVSSFLTPNVADFQFMFRGCMGLSNLDVSSFDISNATNTQSMFYRCSGLSVLDLSNFKNNNIKNANGMFNFCTGLEEIIFSEEFDTSQITDMSGMFQRCTSLRNINVSMFDTSSVTTMDSMFSLCENLREVDLSEFITPSLKNVGYMFNGCSKLEELDLSSFVTNNITSFNSMFINCNSLKHINMSSFTAENATTLSGMFSGCSGLLELDLSNFNAPIVENTSNMFVSCKSLETVDLSAINMSKVTTCNAMFQGCTGLKSLDLSSWNTGKVTNMNNMFSNCSSLTELVVTSFNTENVTTMEGMFSSCFNLQSLNLVNFNTSKVTDMSNMFASCRALAELNISNFDTGKVTDMSHMFEYCVALPYIDCSVLDFKSVLYANNMFQGCSALLEVDLSNKTTSKLIDASYMFNACGASTINMENCNFEKVTNAKGFMQTASNVETVYPPINIKTNIDFNANKLSVESLLRIIDNLVETSTANTLTIGATNLKKLSDEQIASIVNKNWSVN